MVGQLLTFKISKVFVTLLTLALAGYGAWGVFLLDTRFESVWFLPKTSYLRQWFEAKDRHFPGSGELVKVHMTGLDYPEELVKIKSLVANLEGATDIISEVDAWYPVYEAYLNHHIGLAAVNKSVPGTYTFGHLRITQNVDASC